MTDQSKRNARRGAVLLGLGLVLGLGLAATYVYSSESGESGHAHEVAQATISTASAPTVSPGAKTLLDEFAGAFENAATRVDASVVPILSEQRLETQITRLDPFQGQEGWGPGELFRRFFFDVPRGQGSGERLQSLGSGVIVTDDGYILTNNHVVREADRLTVITADGKHHEAEVVGTDPETDLAVIKIEADGLTPATFGDSSDLRVGQWVIAVGNPLRMLHSVTAGIISATGRSAVGIANYENFIQTDASINPGNSGGALANLDGEVVGINTAIASPSGGNVGVGFAIPINMAHQVMDQLIAHGSISRGYLGVMIQDLNDTLASGLGLKDAQGALVGDVTAGSPADDAGMKRGDVIVRFDGQDVADAATLRNMVAAVAPDTRVRVEVIRDGRHVTLSTRLDERPASEELAARRGAPTETQKHLGLSVQDLTPDLASHLGYEGAQGVLVAGTDPGSAAELAGLRRGDLIVEANKTEVHSVSEFSRVVAKAKSGAPIVLVVRRGENTFFVAIQPDEG